jgi:hypothetical protein
MEQFSVSRLTQFWVLVLEGLRLNLKFEILILLQFRHK